jgi:hypothetical protein
LSTIWFDLASKEAHEGGLAGSVATQKPDPLSGLDLTRDRIQQRRATETNQ